jgi:DNA gyrase subunit A
VQRNDANRFSYRVKPGVTGRAVEAHRIHLRTAPEDAVVLVSDRGRAWWGAVGRLPRSASFEELGLAKGERVVGLGLLAKNCCLVLGTRRGQVKRVKADDVKSSAEASWATVVGLGGDDDGVLFAGVGGDDAQVMFLGTGRANRFVAGDVNPQATPSARGVAGIKVGKGDRLLGGAVVSNPAPTGGTQAAAELGVIVVSKNGYLKRVPLGEFSVQGRAGQGVQLLNVTKATGPVVAVALGPMDGGVDLIAADGKRQHLPEGEVPVTNRANRGDKLAELEDVTEVVVL